MRSFLENLMEYEVDYIKNEVVKAPVNYEVLFESIQERDELPIEYVIFLRNINSKNYEIQKENEEGVIHQDGEIDLKHPSVIKIEIDEILRSIDIVKLKTSILRLYIAGRSRNRESYEQVSNWLRSGKLTFQARGSSFSLGILYSKFKRVNKNIMSLMAFKAKLIVFEKSNAKNKEEKLGDFEVTRLQFVEEICNEVQEIISLLENIETLIGSNNEE